MVEPVKKSPIAPEPMERSLGGEITLQDAPLSEVQEAQRKSNYVIVGKDIPDLYVDDFKIEGGWIRIKTPNATPRSLVKGDSKEFWLPPHTIQYIDPPLEDNKLLWVLISVGVLGGIVLSRKYR